MTDTARAVVAGPAAARGAASSAPRASAAPGDLFARILGRAGEATTSKTAASPSAPPAHGAARPGAGSGSHADVTDGAAVGLPAGGEHPGGRSGRTGGHRHPDTPAPTPAAGATAAVAAPFPPPAGAPATFGADPSDAVIGVATPSGPGMIPGTTPVPTLTASASDALRHPTPRATGAADDAGLRPSAPQPAARRPVGAAAGLLPAAAGTTTSPSPARGAGTAGAPDARGVASAAAVLPAATVPPRTTPAGGDSLRAAAPAPAGAPRDTPAHGSRPIPDARPAGGATPRIGAAPTSAVAAAQTPEPRHDANASPSGTQSATGSLAATSLPGPASAQPSATPPAATTPVSAPPSPLAQRLLPQLLPQVIAAVAADGSRSVRVRVTPENLGTVTITAQVSQDGVQVQLAASTPAGHGLLQQLLPQLGQDLAQAGSGASLALQHDGSFGTDVGGQPGGHPTGDRSRRAPRPSTLPHPDRAVTGVRRPLRSTGPTGLDVFA